MYNIFVMSNKLEILKKRLIYRASYRGTKEMDILLSSFVNKYINELSELSLNELENFLNFEDEVIQNFYNHNISKKNIEENKIAQLFKNHKI
jgi:antitoxin CptB